MSKHGSGAIPMIERRGGSSGSGRGSGAVPCCPPITQELSQADAITMAGMFRALSDPVRLRLFSRIASRGGEEVCVCDIQDVGVSQPTVSHHLKKLREAGLLLSQRRGTWVYYRVAPGVLAAMAGMLGAETRR